MMNRETESHFANLPEVKIGRSKMVIPFTNSGTCDAADLIPIYWNEVLPGDTCSMKMSSVIRMTTPLVPVMDNCFCDVMFFFIPRRLTWEHWQAFWGENDTAPWIQKNDYEIPQITAPAKGWTKGSLAEKFGWPTNKGGYSADHQYIRSYLKVWNDWYRDENNKNPVYISNGDSTVTGTDIVDYDAQNPFDPVTDAETGAMPLKVAKPHDYFTSALPGIQKGPEIMIPLGENAPVIWGPPFEGQTTQANMEGKPAGFSYNNTYGTLAVSDDGYNIEGGKGMSLITDFEHAVGASITALRQSFAIQRFYEALARNGSRYIEVLRGVYGTVNPDFRLQRSEYLGGYRLPINIAQVIQSDAGASDATPLGHTGAMSHTADRHDDLFTHSFTEHGIMLGLMCIRTEHTYQQGLNKLFSKKKLFDFYTPQLANISEQAILNKEIYLQGESVVDDDGHVIDEQAFGYQEAYAEYRYMPNVISGELKSDFAQSLDVWTYADDYDELPKLSSDWIDETKVNIQRSLAVENHDQFVYNFYFKPTWVRPMPVYSIPGLTSHF